MSRRGIALLFSAILVITTLPSTVETHALKIFYRGNGAEIADITWKIDINGNEQRLQWRSETHAVVNVPDNGGNGFAHVTASENDTGMVVFDWDSRRNSKASQCFFIANPNCSFSLSIHPHSIVRRGSSSSAPDRNTASAKQSRHQIKSTKRMDDADRYLEIFSNELSKRMARLQKENESVDKDVPLTITGKQLENIANMRQVESKIDHAQPHNVKVRVENIGKYYNPLHVIEQFVNGYYIRNKVRVQLDHAQIGVASVKIHLVPDLGDQDWIVKPHMAKGTDVVALERQNEDTWVLKELVVKSLGDQALFFIGAAGAGGTAASFFGPAAVTTAPNILIEEVWITYRDGIKVVIPVKKRLIPLLATVIPEHLYSAQEMGIF